MYIPNHAFQMLLQRVRTCFLVGIAAVLVVSSASAQTFQRFGVGVRNLGMGNIGVALSHDENALYYNPAGMALIENPIVSLFLLGDVSKNISQITAADEIGLANTVATEDDGDAFNILGERIHTRLAGGATVIVPIERVITLGASYLGEVETQIKAQNPFLIEMSLAMRIDEVQTFGLAFPLGDGHWVMGASAKFVKRHLGLSETTIGITQIITAGDDLEDLADQYDGATDVSNGQGFDLGIQRRFESASDFRMTAGLSIINAGRLTFNSDKTQPKDVPQEINIGFSMQPTFDWIRFLGGIDLRDIGFTATDDRSGTKRLHAGMEVGFFPIDTTSSAFAIRFGYNQGFLAYGFEFNPLIFTRVINIQVAAYTEEAGELPGEDSVPKVAAQLSFSI